MQFLVIARDGTDDEAIERRMGVRPSHLDAIQPLVDAGHVPRRRRDPERGRRHDRVDAPRRLPDRQTLNAWIEADPYVTAACGRRSRSRRTERRWAPGTHDPHG